MSSIQLLRFGIPSLDQMFGGGEVKKPATYGIRLTGNDESTSVCIIGSEGCGKSILGLHLASRYAADLAEAHALAYVFVRLD